MVCRRSQSSTASWRQCQPSPSRETTAAAQLLPPTLILLRCFQDEPRRRRLCSVVGPGRSGRVEKIATRQLSRARPAEFPRPRTTASNIVGNHLAGQSTLAAAHRRQAHCRACCGRLHRLYAGPPAPAVLGGVFSNAGAANKWYRRSTLTGASRFRSQPFKYLRQRHRYANASAYRRCDKRRRKHRDNARRDDCHCWQLWRRDAQRRLSLSMPRVV